MTHIEAHSTRRRKINSSLQQRSIPETTLHLLATLLALQNSMSGVEAQVTSFTEAPTATSVTACAPSGPQAAPKAAACFSCAFGNTSHCTPHSYATILISSSNEHRPATEQNGTTVATAVYCRITCAPLDYAMGEDDRWFGESDDDVGEEYMSK